MGRRSRVLPREICPVTHRGLAARRCWWAESRRETVRVGQKSAEAIVPPRKAGRAEHDETDRSRTLDEPTRRRQEG